MEKVKKITGWILTIIVSFATIAAGIFKNSGTPEISTASASMGLDVGTVSILGIVQILAAILFLIPQTGVLGAFLMIAYYGGAIATELAHPPRPLYLPILFSIIILVAAVLRFPELTSRFIKTNKE